MSSTIMPKEAKERSRESESFRYHNLPPRGSKGESNAAGPLTSVSPSANVMRVESGVRITLPKDAMSAMVLLAKKGEETAANVSSAGAGPAVSQTVPHDLRAKDKRSGEDRSEPYRRQTDRHDLCCGVLPCLGRQSGCRDATDTVKDFTPSGCKDAAKARGSVSNSKRPCSDVPTFAADNRGGSRDISCFSGPATPVCARVKGVQ